MTQRFGNSSWWTEKGEGNKREEHSFLAPTLIPCQSIGRRSLSTLELECLSFTHQTICFIRFIFSPSDPAQPDKALMMKRRGHPCIISELACGKVFVCVCVCARVYVHACAFVCHSTTMSFSDKRMLIRRCQQPTSFSPPVLPWDMVSTFTSLFSQRPFIFPHSALLSNKQWNEWGN